MKLALTLVITLVLGAIACAGPEQIESKDFKQPVVVPEACPIDWTGFYVGLHVGYGWGNADTHFQGLPPDQFTALDPITLDPEPDGIFGGGQAGYNRQFGKFVVGVEADISASDIDGSITQGPIIGVFGAIPNSELFAHEDIEWFGTLRARFGFTPCCRLLLYVTGGLAYGQVSYAGDTRFVAAGGGNPNGVTGGTSGTPGAILSYATSFEEFEFGWTGGGGAQFALNKRWSVKLSIFSWI